MKLKDKTAIVTGSSSGIGRAIALKFAEAGANVVASDIIKEPREGGKPTHKKIQESGGKSIFVKADVSNKKEVKKLISKTTDSYGDVDILVNNAGIHFEDTLDETSEEDWNKIIDINLKGVYLCSKEVLKDMLERDIEGKIINISSIAGLIGFAGSAAYCASKGAVSNLTREMALDYAPHGINVNAICPGVIVTKMTEKFRKNPEKKKALEASTPFHRLGKPEDIANAALFLASEESNFINGANIPVDGGWTAQ